MIEFARFEKDGTVTAGPIDGAAFWGGLTEESGHWPLVQEWVAAGHEIAPYAPPAPTQADVSIERDRRLKAGTVIDVAGYGPIPVQGRDQDQTIMLGLKDTARDLIAASVTDAVIPFRDADDAQHMLTGAQMADLANDGKVWITRVYEASWRLKDAGSGILADFADDAHWPKGR